MEGDGLRAVGEFLFYLACVENDWRAACWKLSWFPSVVLTRIMRGEGEYVIMILAAVQADLLSTTRHRQNSGHFGLLDFILDGYFLV